MLYKLVLPAIFALKFGAAQECATATPSTASKLACQQLAREFPSVLLWPNSTDYSSERVKFWDKRSDLFPACILQAQDESHVVRLVQISKSNNAQFAIRGGGHMNYPGSNSIDGGILVTLNALNHTELSADRTSIAVGPGNKWVDVYDALGPHGLYAIGGRLKTIGVPGLTLIGGFHYFNNKYGFAMDNVLSYDVVLGNGTAVTANATSHSDLFWALKGGANNFGIVTNFVLKTFSAPLISTTIQSYGESQIDSFIRAVCDFSLSDDGSVGAGAVFTLQYNTSTKALSASLLGVQEGTVSPPSRFSNFSIIESTVRVDNVTTPVQWASRLDSPNQMFRIQFAHKTMHPDADQLIKITQRWKNAVEQVLDVEGLYPTLVFNVLPASAHKVAKDNGVGNIWGLQDETQSYIIYQTSTGWDNASDDIRMTQWSRSFIENEHRTNKELGLSSEFIYMGDAGETQDPWSGIPAENFQRMMDIRQAYDPDVVFQKLNYGGFKLGF